MYKNKKFLSFSMSKRIGELSLSPAQKDKLFELMAGDFRCGRRFFASSPRNRMFLSHDDHFLPFLVCRKKATMMMATGRGRVRLFFSRLTFRAEDVVCTSTRFFRYKYLDWGFFFARRMIFFKRHDCHQSLRMSL